MIAILAGAHGLSEINTRLRSDPALQRAFGRRACADESVVSATLNACTSTNVAQLMEALDAIFRQRGLALRHDLVSGNSCNATPHLAIAEGLGTGCTLRPLFRLP